jgi:hypothetical protein
MTIDKVQDQQATIPEKVPISVQNEMKKDMLKETANENSLPQQLLQLLATAKPTQPVSQVQETAKGQIEKGYLDVKV